MQYISFTEVEDLFCRNELTDHGMVVGIVDSQKRSNHLKREHGTFKFSFF